MAFVSRFLRDDSGVTSTEYGFVIGGIALFLVTIVYQLVDSANGKYLSLANAFS